MVDVKEMPITFTPNQPAKLSACNAIEVSLYLYVLLAINNLTKFIVPFSIAKELKMILYYISNFSGEVSHSRESYAVNFYLLLAIIFFL